VIALDTSAIVAVAFGEADARIYLGEIARNECVLGTPTLFEAYVVVRSSGSPAALRILDQLIEHPALAVVAFDKDHFALACAAFDRYGKGRGHPAQLNFGDCLAYAVAKRSGLPLLFKGQDFSKTDLRPAVRS
jgi:ribonuclease VapC